MSSRTRRPAFVLHYCECEGNQAALDSCASTAKPGRKERHAAWESEYQAKNVFSARFLRQKLEYIHSNPLQPDWNLAECPEEYLWSSACFYLTEGRALIPLSDANELLG